MRKLWWALAALILPLFLVSLVQAQPVTLSAAGATFPYPLYSQWAFKYNQTTGLKINYQAIGSGGGIAQIKAKTVDYGASDAPQTTEFLKQNGLVQWPMVMGGVVMAVNVQGIGPAGMRLDGPTIANIYLGKITKWNDPAIVKLNPGVKLPDQAITVVYRTDGSGTTFIFSSYLSAVSPEWKQKVGAGTSVTWPAKNGVGGKGNPGVAGQVKVVPGAIGYVEYAYVKQNNMPYAMLQNKDGKWLKPSLETFAAAAEKADWAKAPYGFYLMLVDQPGANSWPIAGATFIMVHQDQPDAAKAAAMLKYFDWCYKHGQDQAKKLDYVPMPESVVKLVEASWSKYIKANGKPVWPAK